MKYFIGHVLRGRAGEYHRKLSGELADEFGLRALGERIPPHITFKAPFEADEMQTAEIDQLLSRFAKKHASADAVIDRFGSFHGKIIFMGITPSPELEDLMSDLEDALRSISWLSFERNDSGRKKHLHATFARARGREMGEKIREHLKHYNPHFTIALEGISLLVKKKGTWREHTRYDLRQ